MELGLALGIWIASLAVAGAVGWIVGDRHGVGHLAKWTRDEEVEAMREGLFTLTVPPKQPLPPGQRALRAIGTDAEDRISETRHPQRPPARIAQTPSFAMRERAEIFASMPPIAELEEQVRVIRLADDIWSTRQIGEHLATFLAHADLGSLEVLSQYRKAVDDLKPDCSQSEGPVGLYDVPGDTPLLTAAAPVDADALLSALKHLDSDQVEAEELRKFA